MPDSICYVAPDVYVPGPRGSSVHVLELSKSLAKIGFRVHVVARRHSSNDPSVEEIQGITIHRIFRRIALGEKDGRAKFTPSKLGKLYFIYLRTAFMIYAAYKVASIVHRNHIGSILERETAFGAGAVASAITRRPLILEIIGPRYSRLSVSVSKKILYYTESMLRSWVPASKCVKVPAGVDPESFKPDNTFRSDIRRIMGITPEDFVFGYVGTFQEWHGLETLLCVTKELRSSFPEVKLLLIGPGYSHYKSLSESMGLSDVCVFPGPISHEDVPRYINACDAMVALYEPERERLRKNYGIGFPIKILEYIACGKPVISTRIDPVIGLAKRTGSMLLIEQGNREQLTSAMKELLSVESHSVVNVDSVRNYSWDELGKTVSECLST